MSATNTPKPAVSVQAGECLEKKQFEKKEESRAIRAIGKLTFFRYNLFVFVILLKKKFKNKIKTTSFTCVERCSGVLIGFFCCSEPSVLNF